MKEFRLSTRGERIAGISFSVLVVIGFIVLLYALRSQTMLMIVCGIGMLLITALLVFYVLNVLKAACIVDAENKTIAVKGATDYTVDISEAVLLQTVGKKNSQTSIRVLVFTDTQENVVASIPTMFTYKQGIWAEPMAKEMAQYLGIEFQQNIPEWEYDKEKFKEHQKEESEREKREAKERRKKRMEYRIRKMKQRK